MIAAIRIAGVAPAFHLVVIEIGGVFPVRTDAENKRYAGPQMLRSPGLLQNRVPVGRMLGVYVENHEVFRSEAPQRIRLSAYIGLCPLVERRLVSGIGFLGPPCV